VTVGVLVDRDDVGDRLAPGQLVRVVLEGPGEDDGTFAGRDLRHQVVTVVQLGRDSQPEDADHPVDGARAAGAREDHGGGVVTVDVVMDEPAGVLAQPGGLEPGAAGLGVGVRVPRQHFVPDEVLDEVEAAPRRRVVGVGDAARPVRSRHHLVVADDGSADPFQQR
jgi:hypothetical protein